MRRVGLTGGIGSGKSTVARVFGTLGVPVFDADDEGRQLLNEKGPVREAVIGAFGADLYDASQLDRKALAAIVFNDHEALAGLNAIVHPAVRTRSNAWCAQHKQAAYVIMESAILAETGGDKAMDHLVVVTAPAELRVSRVMARDGVGEQEVRDRMRNQSDDAARTARADTVIVNDDRTMVIPQVLAIHAAMGGGAAHGVSKPLPLSLVSLIFGLGSIPLAFARHLVSLAAVMAVVAIAFHFWGRWRSRNTGFSVKSLTRSRIGLFAASAGLAASVVMWILWATNALLDK